MEQKAFRNDRGPNLRHSHSKPLPILSEEKKIGTKMVAHTHSHRHTWKTGQ